MTGGESSQDRGIVVLPQKVLGKIDRFRDRLGRAEFIEVCIDSLLEGGEVPVEIGKQTEYGTVAGRERAETTVSREEFEEFKKGIKNLQRAYIDMLLTFTVEPAASATKEEQERLTQRVRELLENQ